MAGSANPRVLFVLSSANPVLPDGKKSGWYWSEVYYPYEEFIKAGYQCDAMSLTGSGAPDEHSVEIMTELMSMEMSAMAAWRNKSHSIHKMIANLKKPSDINPSNYQIIFFAGGHACLYDLPTAEPIHRIAANIYEHGGIVAAVCHGPAVFQGLKLSDGSLLIRGKRATGFTKDEEEKVGLMDWVRKEGKPLMKEVIEGGGGFWSEAGVMKSNVIVEGRLLTGQNPTSAGPLAEACINKWKQLQNPMSMGSTTTSSTMNTTFGNTAPNMVKPEATQGDGIFEPSLKQQHQLHDYVEQPDFKQ